MHLIECTLPSLGVASRFLGRHSWISSQPVRGVCRQGSPTYIWEAKTSAHATIPDPRGTSRITQVAGEALTCSGPDGVEVRG